MTIRRFSSFILPCLPLLLAACGDSTDVEPDATAMTAPEGPVALSPPVLLETLEASDVSAADLEGELGCSFLATRGDDPLLVANAFVAAEAGADAAMRINGETVPLSMAGAGGYNRMANGGTFMGDNVSATVEVLDEQPLDEDPQVAMESPIVPARLTVQSVDRQIAVDGYYECGP